VTAPEVVALEDPAALGTLAADWDDFARRREHSSYFQTADWVLAWWDTVAGRPPTRIAAWRGSAGRLEALVALSEDRTRLHRAIPVDLPVHVNAGSGPGAADHCGWLVGADRRTEVAAWIEQAIGGAGLLLRGADPAWEPAPLPAGARVIAVTRCPRMTLPAPGGPIGRSRELRRQLPRLSRRLEREGVRFEWVAPGEVDEPLVRALLALHARAWATREHTTAFGPEQLALHLRLAERGGADGGPAAAVARHDGTIVGVQYGFWWRDTFAAYQMGWDPAWARFSLGSVLLYHAIRFAAIGGARTFDFLRGTEAYKYRFGAADRDDRTWMVPRGPAGHLLSARYRARDRIRPRRRPEAAGSA
jgi:CelD/BcsL family acetyltransferase involved in cellulose biosynthesis